MSRENLTCTGGPHDGEVYSLDVLLGDEVSLPNPGGRAVIYRRGRNYIEGLDRLLFVGEDPMATAPTGEEYRPTG